MKTIIKITLSILLVIGTFTACVDDKDFDTPQVIQEDNDISTSPFSAVKNALIQGYDEYDPSTLVYTFDVNSPVIIPAYVVSDDTSGNFYKKLVVQDASENPMGGLEITIDQGSLHTTYNVGRKIYIKMAGLSVTYLDGSQGGAPGYINESEPGNGTPGVYKVGIKGEGFTINRIPSAAFENHIIRSSVTETMVPQIISPTDFNDDTMNTFVQIDGMQFEINELGKTFAGEAGDSFDAERVLLNCATEATFGLMTSTFSNFKSIGLPDQKGTVIGILAKNYREARSVVILNKYDDLNFTETDRCDPLILDCANGATGGSNVIFSQDFESITDESDLIGLGWTNVNTNAGSHIWIDRTYSGNRYMQMGAYNTNEDPLEAWLVTPAINLDSSTDEILTFDTNVGYYRGDALSVYASSDFTGDVSTATWYLINGLNLPTGPSSGYGSFGSAGNVDLSCLSGDVHIAFKYLGADGGVTTTFQLDNIVVNGN
ncbi:MAG: DUF5689 domain-containing protein [Flavobacteriaceae bacterium]